MLPYRPWPPGAQPAPVISMAADGAHIDVAALLAGLTNDLLPPLPADNPLLEPPDRMRSPTPEPLEEQDLVAMRVRALAIKESPGNGKGKGREDTVEQELLQMVLALTAAPTAQSQLLDQATTISRLLKQQDFLINRMGNDRALWETEKESMQRVAEALLTQVNAGHSYVSDVRTLTSPVCLSYNIRFQYARKIMRTPSFLSPKSLSFVRRYVQRQHAGPSLSERTSARRQSIQNDLS